jgi:hypothetical protein
MARESRQPLRRVNYATGPQSSRGLPSSYIADHAGQILHPNRLCNVYVDASIFRASSCFRACNAGESSDVNPRKTASTFVVANLGGGFETVHDLDRGQQNKRKVERKQDLTGMFMSIKTRK